MTPTTRICLVAPGTSVHSKRWAESLQKRGHDVLWAHLTRQPTLPTSVESFAPYSLMGRWRPPKLHYLLAYSLMRRRIARFAPDIVHMHYLDPQRSWMIQSHQWDRFVISVWGSDILWSGQAPEPNSQARAKKRLLARAQQVTATNSYLAEVTLPYLDPGKNIDIVPFGVDTEIFHPSGTILDKPTVTIGFVKHFAPNYGPDVLIESMQRVCRKHPNARAVLIGDRDRAPYEAMVEDLDLTRFVSLRGPVDYDKIPALMNEFDIFCMPSRQESFGVAALEASASGLPVVACDVGGVRDVVQDERTGFLVPPGDPRALAEKLSELIDEPEMARHLGRSGREFVERNFEWEANVAQMEELYEKLMD